MSGRKSAILSEDPSGAPVIWREGIYLVGTPIWCDARRARDVCFVSCAHAAGASRHGQLIATTPTLALLGPDPQGTQLPVPYGRPFTLGTVRLELVRSGHSLGSASLVADVHGHRVLYAGTVNPRGGGLGGAADLRACDAVVVAAAYGEPRYVFPPVHDMAAEVTAFAQEVIAAGGVAALLVTSPSKALDVASHLAERAPLSFLAHRSICEAGRRLRPTHPTLPRMRRWAAGMPGGHVLLWPAQQRDTLGPLPPGSRTALVSGRALDPQMVTSLAVDAAYPWSDQADHDSLLAYIESCGARQVFLTHRHAERLAAALDCPARRVRALGPPMQMPLFTR